jgi:hypothetical protein
MYQVKDKMDRGKRKAVILFFFNFESRNYISKQLLNIQRDDGSIITSQNDILQETKILYENLYRRRENVE